MKPVPSAYVVRVGRFVAALSIHAGRVRLTMRRRRPRARAFARLWKLCRACGEDFIADGFDVCAECESRAYWLATEAARQGGRS